MKEFFKTILLFALVGTAILLLRGLFYEQSQAKDNTEKDIEVVLSEYNLSDMIVPYKYLISFGPNTMTMSYDSSKYPLWNQTKAIAKDLLNNKDLIIEAFDKDLSEIYSKERSVVYYFPQKITTSIIAKTWGVKEDQELFDMIPNLRKLTVYLGNSEPFLVFSTNEVSVKVTAPSLKVTELKDEVIRIEKTSNFDYYYSMEEIFGTGNKEVFLPYGIKESPPSVYFTNSFANMTENDKGRIAVRFLERNIDYIRQVVESNGSNIYISGNDVVKINSNGSLEYFSSLREKVTERNLFLSMSSAAEFIAKKARGQGGMYLSNIYELEQDGSLGYTFMYRYRVRGIPVLLGNKEITHYIQLDVFNNQITKYKQLYRFENDLNIEVQRESRKIISSYDVIDKNYMLLEARYLESLEKPTEATEQMLIDKVLSGINEIALSYYDPSLKEKEEKLLPVWQIVAFGKVFAFNAYTGTIVYEK